MIRPKKINIAYETLSSQIKSAPYKYGADFYSMKHTLCNVILILQQVHNQNL